MWAWARPAGGARRVSVNMRWGPLGLHVERSCDGRGLIVTGPASVSNPPVRIDLDTFGWVDFGQGPSPANSACPPSPACPTTRIAAPHDHTLAIFTAWLRPILNRRGNWLNVLKRFVSQRSDLLEAGLGHQPPSPRGHRPHRRRSLTHPAARADVDSGGLPDAPRSTRPVTAGRRRPSHDHDGLGARRR